MADPPEPGDLCWLFVFFFFSEPWMLRWAWEISGLNLRREISPARATSEVRCAPVGCPPPGGPLLGGRKWPRPTEACLAALARPYGRLDSCASAAFPAIAAGLIHGISHRDWAREHLPADPVNSAAS